MYNNYIYKDYNKYLLEKYVVKPHKNSRYATQGVTQVNDAVFITYYDTDKLKNSIVDIVRNDKHITLELDNKSHVGGVSYSKEYNKVFISNNRFVNTYPGSGTNTNLGQFFASFPNLYKFFYY